MTRLYYQYLSRVYSEIPANNIRSQIRIQCSAKYFKEFALPYLMSRSPHVSLNYLFVDTHHHVFEHVVGIPEKIASFSLIKYTKVCIYGCGKLLMSEIVRPIMQKGYKDYEVLTSKEKSNLKSEDRCRARCKILKEEIIMAAYHPDRIAKLLEAGLDLDDM